MGAVKRRTWDILPTSFAGQQNDSPQTVLCTVPQLFAHGKFSNAFLMPPALRAWPKILRLTKGADENFGLPTFVSGYKLNIEKRKRLYLLCYREMLIRPLDLQRLLLCDRALYCSPKLVATAAAFGREGHYAVVIEHACDVLQILLQLVVR
jgi:hypothetical protein